ncbi:MAG: dihydroorotate dehydrogenase [Verrucomicrobia bacterium]|nr:dihydroorotate dehydrogenase [Verrucomicrobiota bacterium]
MSDVSVNIGGIRMKTPVMVASGTFGYGPEYADLVDLSGLGAIVVKGICVEPTLGNMTPRTAETRSGMLNAIGLPNPGFEGFVEKHMPFLRQYDVPVIVNVWGRTLEEYADIAEKFDSVDGVAGLEVNVSCPNIKEGSGLFGTDLNMFRQAIAGMRERTRLPLIPKLAPNVSDIKSFARTAEDCGADAISLINSYPAMAIDINTRRPKLANVTGGLSGPAIHPIAVKLVWEASSAVNIPVIGMGGIMTWEDAVEFIIAGATAVAVGTANFVNPLTAIEVAGGIREFLDRNGMASVSELTGTLET